MRDEVLAGQALLPQVLLLAELVCAHEELVVQSLGQRLAIVIPSGDYRVRLYCSHRGDSLIYAL